MLFNSFAFLIFFPTVVVGYFVIPQRFRWIFLLAASYFFYMYWRPEYALIILASTVVDYVAALVMDAQKNSRVRFLCLLVSLIFNLGLLFVFKYFNFFLDSFGTVVHHFQPGYQWTALNVLLPVGISFYTFQTLSYTIDVYRQVRKPERHFGIFALYVVFFPQLVAGPIERSTHLLPQFFEKHGFDYNRFVMGLRRMLWGFFKKVLIADNLAIVADHIFNSPTEYSGVALIFAAICFTFQIYCDFSGYSDIAIGAAKILGYDLMENFRRPYIAKSITEFWQRWHISLSTWLRDYLYMPLSIYFRHLGMFGATLALMMTFFLIGLWHGANWTFAIFGILHGIVMCFELLTKKWWKRTAKSIPTWLQTILLVPLVYFFWAFSLIYFRSNSLGDAYYIVTHLFDFSTTAQFVKDLMTPGVAVELIGLYKKELALIFGFVGVMELIQWFVKDETIEEWLHRKSIWLRWGFYIFCVTSILVFGQFKQNQFIYFVF